MKILKSVLLTIAILYMVSYITLVPYVNSELVLIPERCLGPADKIYIPKPSGLSLLSYHIKYNSKVDMHIIAGREYGSVHNLDTWVYPLAPFFAQFTYEFESEGFECSGNGNAYIWFNGVNMSYENHKIT